MSHVNSLHWNCIHSESVLRIHKHEKYKVGFYQLRTHDVFKHKYIIIRNMLKLKILNVWLNDIFIGFFNIKSLFLKDQEQNFFGIYVFSLSRRVCYLSGILKWIIFPLKLHVYHKNCHRIEKITCIIYSTCTSYVCIFSKNDNYFTL